MMLAEPAFFQLPPPATAEGDWCVYLILCANGAFYCGISNRPQQRYRAHVAGLGARYTRMHKPIAMRLVYQHIFRTQAAQLEPVIKRLKSTQKQALWAALPDWSDGAAD